ncbi:hypothetical protein [Gemmata sp.]|uniref:hypothetical protein n=1 Tax=Gemmata sp. TaxID=1914242 RepID=UPI003F705376
MLVDSLVYRHPDPDVEGFVEPAELLQRVADRFPLTVIDHERADRMVREQAGQLATYMSRADTIVTNHLAMLGRVAYVTVRGDGLQVGFFLFPRPTIIDFEYEPPENRAACRSLIEAVAEALPEYHLVSEELED